MEHAGRRPASAQARRADAQSAPASSRALAGSERRATASAQHGPGDALAQSPRLLAQTASRAGIDTSPAVVAQRKLIGHVFGPALLQRAATGEDAEPLQGRLATAQPAGLQDEEVQMKRDPSTPIQRYSLTRADDGGSFVGDKAACHCHIEIGSPHFKVGKDQSTRKNFGQDMSLERMQRAYDYMLANHQGKSGFADCKEYLEEQGCVEAEGSDTVGDLKALLLKWGGLSDSAIHYYTADGLTEELPVHDVAQLDDVILGAEEQIRLSDDVYSDFLEEGAMLSPQHRELDFEAMEGERNDIFEDERRKARAK